MQFGKLGVWNAMDPMSAADGAAFAKRVEAWGYSALWMPESRGAMSGAMIASAPMAPST